MRRFFACFAFAAGLIAAPFAADARVNIRINLAAQTMHVTSPDGGEYRWAISSGKKGFRTPGGVYGAKRLARMHYSRKYDNSPMPHSIFFRGGYAIHGTGAVGMLGRPASHGCIRLAPGNAAKLFAMVRAHGARIAIGGSAPDDGRVYARAKKKRVIARADDDFGAMRPFDGCCVPGFIDARSQRWSSGSGAMRPGWRWR